MRNKLEQQKINNGGKMHPAHGAKIISKITQPKPQQTSLTYRNITSSQQRNNRKLSSLAFLASPGFDRLPLSFSDAQSHGSQSQWIA